MFFLNKLVLIVLLVFVTSSYGQSISSEYNNRGSENSSNLIKNYIKNNLNTSNSNYICFDEIAFASKVISLSTSEIKSKNFIPALVDNNPPYVGTFFRNGNIIKWEECNPNLCSSITSKNELQLSSDKKTSNLFEKTIICDYTTITKYKCNLINNQSPLSSSKTSDLKDEFEKLIDQCNKGNGRSCAEWGAIIYKDKKSSPKGLFYLKKSCDLNSADGCLFAGLKLTTEEMLTSKDFSDGMLLLKKSCSLNNSLGCKLAGVMLISEVFKKKTAQELNKEDIIQLKESKLMLERSCKSNNEESCEILKKITRIINDYS